MRGSFNNELAVRYGPRSTVGPPGVTYAVGIPCRRVPQTRLSQGQFDFTLANHWVTQDTVVFNPPAVSSPWLGAFLTDQLAADEVSFADAPGDWYSVCRHEEVEPDVGPDYRRDMIIPVHRLEFPWWLPLSPLPRGPGLALVASCNGVNFDSLISSTLYIHFGRPPAIPCTGDFAVLNDETVGPLLWDGVHWYCGPQLGFTDLIVQPNYLDAGRPVIGTVGVSLAGAVNDVTGLSPNSCTGFRLNNATTATGSLGAGIVSYIVDDSAA